MQVKSIKLLTLLLTVTLALLIFGGCGKSGTRFANLAPTISITSYEGFDDSALLAPYANTVFLFQQRIYWHATDPDGIITGFAYRVKNQNGDPIATPGNHFVDMDGSVTPQNVLDRFGPGWVMHYMPGADQSIPLSNPEARRWVWTSQKYALINFPASDANGNPLTLESTFEVIAIDNRGEITPLDPNYTALHRSVAWRKFNATSARPKCILSTTKGNPNGGAVGSGIKLMFSMKDYDPFIPETPFKYEFRMLKVHPTTGAPIAGTETEWFNTSGQYRLSEYLLTRYTTPALTYDFNASNTLISKTKIFARVQDLAGVVSYADSASINFAVKPGFRPKTMIYPQKLYALGDNHFIDYSDESTPEIFPFTIIGGAQRFATAFFKDMEGNTTAINSNNLKVWIRWGWRGEYGTLPASGVPNPTDNPYDKKLDMVLDRETGANYFSEITHFDLRLNGEPYNFPPYANNIITDGDGKRWIRIPQHSPLGQTVVLTSLITDTHTFEVRCVDLQGEVDPIPAVFSFTLHAPIPKAQREGVLIIDDDFHNAGTSPDATVNAKYVNMLSDFVGTKTFIKRTTSVNLPGNTYPDGNSRNFATSDLQKYKLVIYHNDNPDDTGNLKLENDGLVLYMHTGGNVLISHTAKLSQVLESFVKSTQKTFLSYFGVPYRSNPASFMSAALHIRPIFQKAVGQNAYPDVNLQWGATGTPEASFNSIVNARQGLSTITFFPFAEAASYNLNRIYNMGLKPVTYPVFPPSQADFDLYNNKPIGIRSINTNNRCYLFGFPLSYMQDMDTKALMNKILSEIM
ncbi:MAG: hypothetical protein Q8M98_04930 [Candidatus Cloacimonadaceae bacterium]|nr:hypothetical protein [Candidatus Cloacimonadaceae bacterium]MDP3114105.1 hypothetical protein [Candidatus Cloacimonadaceae bacterium]